MPTREVTFIFVTALLGGLLLASPTQAADSGNLSVRLQGRYSAGHVSDLPGARVVAENIDSGLLLEIPVYGDPDTSGFYESKTIPWGRYHIRVSAPTFVEQYWPQQYTSLSAGIVRFGESPNCDPLASSVCPDHALKMELSQPLGLSGTVRQRDGRTVPGIRVSARLDSEPDYEPWTVSDQEGRFAMDIPPGDYTLVAPNGATEVKAAVTLTSNTVRNLTLLDAPSPPLELQATAGNGQVALRWKPPSDDGGDPILRYLATASPGLATCSTEAPACVIDGLENGKQYTFTVKAVNKVGESLPSAESSPVRPGPGIPLPPRNVRVSGGNTTIEVTWSASQSEGVIEYIATAEPGGHSCSASDLNCVIRDLRNGRHYVVTVRSVSLNGTSTNSDPSEDVVPATTPEPPRAVTAISKPGALEVRWDVPVDDGGAPIRGYAATAWPGGSTCTTSRADTKCRIGKLRARTRYTVTVRARNSEGYGASSPGSSYVQPKPSRANALHIKDLTAQTTAHRLTLRWRNLQAARFFQVRIYITRTGWGPWTITKRPPARFEKQQGLSKAQVRARGAKRYGPISQVRVQ